MLVSEIDANEAATPGWSLSVLSELPSVSKMARDLTDFSLL